MLKKPEGLDPIASRIWDEYLQEMSVIQTLFIRIAKLSDAEAFNYLNTWCALCSNICGEYLEAQTGPTQ